MPTPTWGESAERYEQMYVQLAKELGLDDLGSPVLPYIADGERVLDLGCATGWQARQLVARGCTVVGVEVDADAAARATAWCERVVVCDLDVADVSSLMGGEQFDVVAAGDVIEHLRDPLRLLQALPALLRPEGRVVASIPNVAHGSVRLALVTGAFAYDEAGLLDRTHLRFFTLSTIREMFAAAGYAIERLERTEVPIDQGVPYDRELLPSGVEDAVAAMPEATTFQYVVVARPVEPSRRQAAVDGHPRDEPDDLLRAQANALRERDAELMELRRTVAQLEHRLEQASDLKGRETWLRARDRVRRALHRLTRTAASTCRSSRSGPSAP